MPKYACKFNAALQTEFPFIKPQRGSESDVLCEICSSSFKISVRGRGDIVAHNLTAKHLKATKTAGSNQAIDSMMKSNALQANELAFAYHSGRHRASGRTADCNSKLISACFEPKFASGKTKTAELIEKLISPQIERNVSSALEKLNFVAVITDTSHGKPDKMLPILVRGFDVSEGVKVFKLAVKIFTDETSEAVGKELIATGKAWKVEEKVIAFGGDNFATNFGEVNRTGENNVFFHLKQMLDRKIVGVGCSCHIIHNAYDSACDQLPVNIEALVVKIYKHFHIHSEVQAPRVESLEAIYEDHEVTYAKLISQSGSRFLKLHPAVKKVISMFFPLKDYFNKLSNCPTAIHKFFNRRDALFWLNFVESQLKSSNEHELKTDGKERASFEVAAEVSLLRAKAENRKNSLFIPFSAEIIFNTFEDNEKDYARTYMKRFYSSLIDYLDKWTESLDGTEVFGWMDLTKAPDWNLHVKPSLEFFYEHSNAEQIDADAAFDETHLLRQLVQEKVFEWNHKKLTSEKRWLDVLAAENLRLKNLSLLVQYAFAIPGSSTEVERLFSIIKDAWGPDKPHMSLATLEAYLNIKVNSDLSCSQYYESIKNNSLLLSQVQSTQKHQLASTSSPQSNEQEIPEEVEYESFEEMFDDFELNFE